MCASSYLLLELGRLCMEQNLPKLGLQCIKSLESKLSAEFCVSLFCCQYSATCFCNRCFSSFLIGVRFPEVFCYITAARSAGKTPKSVDVLLICPKIILMLSLSSSNCVSMGELEFNTQVAEYHILIWRDIVISSSSSLFICVTLYNVRTYEDKTLQCNRTERHRVHLQLLPLEMLICLKLTLFPL